MLLAAATENASALEAARIPWNSRGAMTDLSVGERKISLLRRLGRL